MNNNRDFVQILADLKFISSVKKGEVMYIADRVVAPRSIFSTMYRRYWIKGESGQDTANFISKTLEQTYKLIGRYQQIEGSEKYIEHLINHIEDVENVIEDLKVTYEGKSYILALFDAIKIEIDRSLEIYKEKSSE